MVEIARDELIDINQPNQGYVGRYAGNAGINEKINVFALLCFFISLR